MKKLIYTFLFVCPMLMLVGCVGEDLSELQIDQTKGISYQGNSGNTDTSTDKDPGKPAGYVDLGLSVYWSVKNLGASKPEDAGKTYTIGYPNTAQLSGSADIIHTKYDTSIWGWGEPWTMPTKSEWEELINKCTWTYENNNGVRGFRATGTNGQSIFFPTGSVKCDNEYVVPNKGSLSCLFWTGTYGYDNYYPSRYYFAYIYLDDDDTIKKLIQRGVTYGNYTYHSFSVRWNENEFFIRPVQEKN